MASDPTLPDPKPADRRYLRATLAGAGGLLALVWFLLDQRPELAQLLLERIIKPVYPEPRGARRRGVRAVCEICYLKSEIGLRP